MHAYESAGRREGVEPYEAGAAAEVSIPNRRWGYRTAKRGMDIIGGLLGLVLASPVILIAALAIKIEDPRG